MINFRCNRCAEDVLAGDQEAGRGVTCRHCGHVNTCPAVSAARPRWESRTRSLSAARTFWAVVGMLALATLGWGAWDVFEQADASAAPSSAANPAEARQQEILKQDIGKPGDPVLDRMYVEINAGHFSGALPAMPVLWEPRLAEVGALAANTFTLEGMFGHVGRRTVILLNPALQSDPRALERALCHEMVHAHLFAAGDTTTNHGAAFQTVLRRLSDEHAFEGIVASDAERATLRAWLDAESARLDAERADIDREGGDVDRDRAEVERELADLNARITTANAQGRGWPDPAELAAVQKRRDAYNQRASDANARVLRDKADLDAFNGQVKRYNLMLSYPDGFDEESIVKPKLATPRGGVR